MRYQATFIAASGVTNGNPESFDEGPGFIQLKAPAGSVLSPSRFRYAVIDGSKGEVPSSVTVNPGGAENVVDLFLPNNVPIAAGDKVEVAAYEVKNPDQKAPRKSGSRHPRTSTKLRSPSRSAPPAPSAN